MYGSIQGVEIIRGCRGLNLVGCDLVEVSPPYDTTGMRTNYTKSEISKEICEKNMNQLVHFFLHR